MTRRDLFRFLPAAVAGRVYAGGVRTLPAPIRIGIKEVDGLTAGLPAGSLTVLYGQKEAGKTTLAMNIAGHVAVEEGRPVLYILQRDSAEAFVMRLICSRARVDYLDFTAGRLGSEKRIRFKAARRELVASSFTIDDTPGLSDSEIVRAIETWSAKQPGGLAIVDHIGERQTAGDADSCSQALKSVAVRTKTAILATSYLFEDPLQGNERQAPVSLSPADFSMWLLRLRWWDDAQFLSLSDQREPTRSVFRWTSCARADATPVVVCS